MARCSDDLPEKWFRSRRRGRRQHFRDIRVGSRISRTNPRWFLFILVPVLCTSVAVYETRTSRFQAKIFSTIAARLSYRIGTGASPRIVFPSAGPFNERRGYAQLPLFKDRLVGAGYHVAAQAILSPELRQLAS